MRPKDKQINPGNDISEQILNLLKRNQGDETLYSLSKHIGMQQGTLRRKLENPNGWNEIKYINGIIDFFNISYNVLFHRSSIIDSEKEIFKMYEIQYDKLVDSNIHLKNLLNEIRNVNGNEIIEMAEKRLSEKPLFSTKTLTPDDPMHRAVKEAIRQSVYKK